MLGGEKHDRLEGKGEREQKERRPEWESRPCCNLAGIRKWEQQFPLE